MTEDLLRQLRQFQRYAVSLESRIAQAQAQVPSAAEGSDPSGAIHALLGPDGGPELIGVDDGWQRRLQPEMLGPAVVEACQAAIGQWLNQWSQSLDDEGWRAGRDRLPAGDDAMPAQPADAVAIEKSAVELPDEWRRRIEEARPRPLEELTEDVLRALDGIGELAATTPVEPTGVGHDDSGRLTVTLSGTMLVSCAVEPAWASGQRGSALSSALSQALAAARAELARTAPAPPAPATGVDQLLAEALALLSDPRRLADS